MADGRMLKKAISESRRMALLKNDTHRLIYTWMIPHLDVEGRMTADSDLFKGKVVPRLKNITPDKIEEALLDMASLDLILLYEVDGDKYLELRNFDRHNKVRKDREGESNIPSPGEGQELSGSDTGECRGKLREDKLREDIYTCVFDFWNQQEIIKHKEISPKIKQAINGALKNKKTPEMIVEAITNYAYVVKSKDHYFSHKWTLEDFIQRGLSKFLPEADPLENFKNKPFGENGTSKPGDWANE